MAMLHGYKVYLCAGCIMFVCLLTWIYVPDYINFNRPIISLGKSCFAEPSNKGLINQSVVLAGQQRQGQDVTAEACNDWKIILFWTKYYGAPVWWSMGNKLGDKIFHQQNCTYKNCILTADKSRVDEANLLLFHLYDTEPWPRHRHPNQYYAHFIHEAPPNSPKGVIHNYNGRINLTINYRHDADMYTPYQKTRIYQSKQVYIPKYSVKDKPKQIVWPVSHCATHSNRERYVKELSKYIDVDIYGDCGKLKCDRSKRTKCLQKWESSYKFYLSFENSICKDYITEKMFHPMNYEMIPIVLGGGNYSRDAPPHSVINARDYKSPKELAEYLLYLSQHEEDYNRYFEWKTRYTFHSMPDILICELCQALHEDKFGHRPARTDYEQWWFGDNNHHVCDNGLVNRMSEYW